jgi:hypothetical protein
VLCLKRSSSVSEIPDVKVENLKEFDLIEDSWIGRKASIFDAELSNIARARHILVNSIVSIDPIVAFTVIKKTAIKQRGIH